MDPRRHLV